MKEIHLSPIYLVKNYIDEHLSIKQSSNNSRNIQCIRINHTLYYQYSSSQNYYYTKEINEILQVSRTKSNILYIDYNHYDESQEYLKRYYYQPEFKPKIKVLAEFYKYHKDLPRWVIHKEIVSTLNYYYDKKRKIEYYRIQRLIQQENAKNPGRPQKGIVGDQPIDSQSTPFTSDDEESKEGTAVKTILKDLTMTHNFFETPIHGKKDQTFYYVLTPSQLQIEQSKQSMEMKQIISLLNISDEKKLEQQNQNVPKAKISFQKNEKNAKKRKLKLDEQFFMNQIQQDLKGPQSARYQPLNQRLFEQLVQVNRKKSETISKERKKGMQQQQQQQLFQSKKTLSQQQESVNQKKAIRLKEDQKKSRPKVSNDIKSLEKKIFEGLKDFQCLKSRKPDSFKVDAKIKQLIVNQKEILGLEEKREKLKMKKNLNLILPHHSIENIMKLYNKQSSSNRSVSKSNYFSNCTARSPNSMMINLVNPRAKSKLGRYQCHKEQKIQTLDLRSLAQQSWKQTEVYSARSEKKSIEDSLKMKDIKTERGIQEKRKTKGLSMGSFKENNSYTMTPKGYCGNRRFQSMMQWQIKAMQAVQKEYNLIPKS